MKLLFKLLLLCFSATLWSMEEEKDAEQYIPISTYDNEEIKFPMSIISQIPFLNTAITFKKEKKQELKIDLKNDELCTQANLLILENLFNNEFFKKFLQNVHKEIGYKTFKELKLSEFMQRIAPDEDFRKYLFEFPFIQEILIKAIVKNSGADIGLTMDERINLKRSPKEILLKVDLLSDIFQRPLLKIGLQKEFENFLPRFSKENIHLCHQALHKIFSLNKSESVLNDLWSLIKLSSYFALDGSIQNAIFSCLDTIDLNMGVDDSTLITEIISQSEIQPPTSLFDNKLHLFKQIEAKENETMSTSAWFDPEMKQCIFLQERNEPSVEKKKLKAVLELKAVDLASTQTTVNSVILEEIINDKKIILNQDRNPCDPENGTFDVSKKKNHIAHARGNTIFIYERDTLKLHKKISRSDEMQYNFYSKLKFSPNGQWLAIKKRGKGIEIYNTSDYKLHQLIDHFTKDFNFGAHEEKIVCGDGSGQLYIYQLNDKKYYQQQHSIKVGQPINECCFIKNDNSVYCTSGSGRSDLIVDYESEKITCTPSSGLYAAYGSAENTIALAHSRISPINFRSIDDNITISTDIKHSTERGLILSPDGNYLLNIEEKVGKAKSIKIYHIPVFSYTAEKIEDSNLKWFAFFCNYWQRNDMPIRSKYNDLYNNLPGPLKIKFNNLLIENRRKLQRENDLAYTIKRKEERRKPFIQQKEEKQILFWQNLRKEQKDNFAQQLRFKVQDISPALNVYLK